MSEKAIVNRIQKYLTSETWFVIKIHGNAYQRAGLPDILAFKDGKAAWFEVKKPGGKVSKLQLKTISLLQSKNITSGVVRSVDEVKEILNERDTDEE